MLPKKMKEKVKDFNREMNPTKRQSNYEKIEEENKAFESI